MSDSYLLPIAVPPELVEAIAERAAELVWERLRAEHAGADRGEELLDERQAAAALGISPRWLRDRRARGAVPYVKLGRRVLYRRCDLAAFAEQRLV